MQIVLMFYGSRGDIQPGVAAGLELQRRGHDVVITVPPNFVDFATSLGLRAYPVGLDTSSVWDTPDAKKILATKNPYTKFKLATATIKAGFAAFDEDMIALLCGPDPVLSGVDALVSGPLCQERMYGFAEKLGVPFTVMRFGPFSENGIISAVPGVTRNLPSTVNRASWRVSDALTWTFTKGAENTFRKKLDLGPARGSLQERLTRDGAVQVQAYDPIVFPGLAEEWGEAKPIVGYLDLPADARGGLAESSRSDPGLWSWLTEGDRPVHITFGSVPVRDPDALTETIILATRAVGVRALITMKGRPDGQDPDHPDVYYARALDHGAVLPQCRAVVHHGGAGTTAAGLRAGLPTMVCSGGADQAYWGAQITRLKVGTATRLKGLDEATLTAGLREILAPETDEHARLLAQHMVAPDIAVSRAVDIIAEMGPFGGVHLRVCSPKGPISGRRD
ncbi:glycosyltransferase [Williamsia sp. 1135]|uniref:glycosyltransferase n=1 Tax=Williamsia sp. 1135 TaxID=1889262 RepID=UPI000A10339C|nr:glycosyltransferase [Williamsia sp. 1135]ORM32565.1 hypothetical protein BFL43_16070 [Williamsia sp. 1135]